MKNKSKRKGQKKPYTANTLYTIRCILYAVYYMLCTIWCILYAVCYTLCTMRCVLYDVYYTVYALRCIVYTVCCIVYDLYYTLCTICCMLYAVYFMLHTIRCILYSVYFMLLILSGNYSVSPYLFLFISVLTPQSISVFSQYLSFVHLTLKSSPVTVSACFFSCRMSPRRQT